MLVIKVNFTFKLFYTNMWIFLNYRELYFSDLFNTIIFYVFFFVDTINFKYFNKIAYQMQLCSRNLSL